MPEPRFRGDNLTTPELIHYQLPFIYTMATIPGTEQVRFRRPTTGPNAVKPKEIKKDEFGSMAPQGWKRRHQGILQDLVGR